MVKIIHVHGKNNLLMVQTAAIAELHRFRDSLIVYTNNVISRRNAFCWVTFSCPSRHAVHSEIFFVRSGDEFPCGKSHAKPSCHFSSSEPWLIERPGEWSGPLTANFNFAVTNVQGWQSVTVNAVLDTQTHNYAHARTQITRQPLGLLGSIVFSVKACRSLGGSGGMLPGKFWNLESLNGWKCIRILQILCFLNLK